VPPPAKPAAIPEPERPALNLVGIVSGTDDGLAVFINSTTRDIVRLRTGEGHEGWILRSVKGREVMFEKNHRNVVIEMPPAGGDQK
jgi:general secretion pathway protein N